MTTDSTTSPPIIIKRSVFEAAIKKLEHAHPYRDPMTVESIDLYHDRLKFYSIEDFNAAVDFLIDNYNFFPSISNIRNTIEEIRDNRKRANNELTLEKIMGLTA